MITAGQAGFQVAAVRKMAVVVIEINHEREADLFEIGNARRLLGLLLGATQRGQQQPGEDRDDGDDHQQFDQGERPARGCDAQFHV